VTARPPQIVAMGGGGFSMEPDNPLLDDFILGLTGVSRPRVLFLPTATGNVATYLVNFYAAFSRRAEASHIDLFTRTRDELRPLLLGQDVVYVGGGNTANLLAIWRVHGLDGILRNAWQAGVVLAGVSAGGMCWFQAGLTDSFGPDLAPLDDGLGLLAGSFCPHYDGEPARRPAYRRLVGERRLPDGWAADDGVALHFIGTDLAEAVSSRPEARAYRLECGADDGTRKATESELATRYLG
jgi:peptidase E